MKTTNKKLQLKKETMAVLNDKSLFAINGGNNPNEEDGDGIETWHTCGAGTCTVNITLNACFTRKDFTCEIGCTVKTTTGTEGIRCTVTR